MDIQNVRYKLVIADYHTHPQGHRDDLVYSSKLLQPWVDKAREKGIKDIVFTDHDRYRLGVLFDEFEQFKNENQDISLKIGIELDNDPKSSKVGRAWVEKNWDKMDYVIGSIHYIGDWPFDHAHYKDEFERWNIAELYQVYFKNIIDMAQSGLIDGIGHLDLIKIFGYKPQHSIINLITEVLTVIQENNLAVEINMSGLRKPVGEQYPSEDILRLVKAMNIPIVISSDAHTASDLGEGYDVLAQLVENVGFTHISLYEKHCRQDIPLL